MAATPALSPLGKAIHHMELRAIVEGRARLEAALQADPTIAQRPVAAPIFVVGLPRTGSTNTHRLLALHPKLRAPAFWELRAPVAPAQGPDRRRQRAQTDVALTRHILPGFHAVHPLEADAPEECVVGTAMALRGLVLGNRAPLPNFLAWTLQADTAPVWRLHRRILQVLGRPGDRWLLKAPEHLFSLAALLDEYPDATIIWLHRDPRKVAPSACNLVRANHLITCCWSDPKAVGAEWLPSWSLATGRARATRAARPDAFVDLHYDDVIADPRAAMDGLRGRLGLPDGGHDEALAALLAQREPVAPSHRSTLADFGLDPAAVAALDPEAIRA